MIYDTNYSLEMGWVLPKIFIGCQNGLGFWSNHNNIKCLNLLFIFSHFENIFKLNNLPIINYETSTKWSNLNENIKRMKISFVKIRIVKQIMQCEISLVCIVKIYTIFWENNNTRIWCSIENYDNLISSDVF